MNTIATYPCDLHAHTTRSDGNDTPYELVMEAQERGIKVLAITDHDVLPPENIALPDGTQQNAVLFAQQKGIHLIRGIEFSCESTVQDVHIVGLGCDWKSDQMLKQIQMIDESKVASYAETIRRLDERGFKITMDEVLMNDGQPIPLHSLQKKRIFDLLAAKGYVETWVDAKMMVREDPYFNVERKKPSGKHIIQLVHDAGGIVILAHPFLIDAQINCDGVSMTRWQYIEQLICAGLDGIESRYTYDKSTCKDKRDNAVLWAETLDFANGRLLISGGSDYHADQKKGVENPRRIGDCGLTEDEFYQMEAFKKLVENTAIAS